MREHGYARYKLDGCRCYVCAWARSKYDEQRTRQIAAGTWQPFVDAQPVREHIAALSAAGVGTRRIESLTGVSRSTLAGIMRGRRGNPPSPKVRRETAASILALTAKAAKPAGGVTVDGTGTARRVQALCAIGWTLSEQARRIGWHVSNYADLTDARPVRTATAQLVAGLYNQLSMAPAPPSLGATRARRMAVAKGWAPPLAWDDDSIDDPGARPSGSLNQAPRESLEQFLWRYEQVAGEGLTWAEVAEKLGVTLYSVKHRVTRARRAGLLKQVAA